MPKKRVTKPTSDALADWLKEKGEVLASADTIARNFGVSKSTANEWLQKLETDGRIVRNRRGRAGMVITWSDECRTNEGVPAGLDDDSGRVAEIDTSDRPAIRPVDRPDAWPNGVKNPRYSAVLDELRATMKGLSIRPETGAVATLMKPPPGRILDDQPDECRTQIGRMEVDPDDRTDAVPDALIRPAEAVETLPAVVQPEPPKAPQKRKGIYVALSVGFGMIGFAALANALLQGVLHAIERADGDLLSAVSFGTVLVTAGLFGALALAAREFATGPLRHLCVLVSLGCIGLTTAFALGYAAHRFETTAASRGHDAAAYAALTADVERLRRERAALGEPRPLEVVQRELKGVRLREECQSKKRELECSRLRETLRTEEARTIALPAVAEALKAKEAEWLKAKPIASADSASAGLASVLNSFGDVISEAGTRKGLWVYQTVWCELLAAVGLAFAAAMWRRA